MSQIGGECRGFYNLKIHRKQIGQDRDCDIKIRRKRIGQDSEYTGDKHNHEVTIKQI
jgi:hypothetical protein